MIRHCNVVPVWHSPCRHTWLAHILKIAYIGTSRSNFNILSRQAPFLPIQSPYTMHRPPLNLFCKYYLPTMEFSASETYSKTHRCLSTVVTSELLVSFWGPGAYLGPSTSVLGDVNCKLDVFTCFWLIYKILWSDIAMQYWCETYRAAIPG